MKEPIVLAWSGGKDSALALQALLASDQFEVVSLMTTFTREFERVSMHGVRRELIEQQAERLNLPLAKSWINPGAGNSEYEEAVSSCLDQFRIEGVQTVAFGDLFLHDIREYRDRLVKQIGMASHYPIWGQETNQLAHRFISDGFRAITCCVDSKQIPVSFCGKEYNHAFLDALPETADLCGENGEFHTFVYDGPLMDSPVDIDLGQEHVDGPFVFKELNLAARNALLSQES